MCLSLGHLLTNPQVRLNLNRYIVGGNLICMYYLEGTLLLLFLSPNSPFPTDGIRYQDAEAKYIIPAGTRVSPCLAPSNYSYHSHSRPPGTRSAGDKVWLYT
jgi:hypothetical protein